MLAVALAISAVMVRMMEEGLEISVGREDPREISTTTFETLLMAPFETPMNHPLPTFEIADQMHHHRLGILLVPENPLEDLYNDIPFEMDLLLSVKGVVVTGDARGALVALLPLLMAVRRKYTAKDPLAHWVELLD